MSKKLQKSSDYSTFFNMLIDICKSKNTTVTAIIDTFASSRSAMTAWKNGTINADIIPEIALKLGVSVDYLLTGKEKSPSLKSDEQELLTYYKQLSEREKIKLVCRAELLAEQEAERVKHQKQVMTTINIAEVAAGAGVSTPFTIDDAFAPREFPRDVIPSNADCGVPINGDSMEPQYPNGCIAWVKCTNEVNYGDVIIAVLNGEPYCKIYQFDGLHSYNNDYETIRINEQDNFSIFGKVVGNFIG